MIDSMRYELMKKHYGQYGSWAVWHPAGDSPKSFTDNMDWVNDPNLLNILNTGYVFVGLNWSSTHGDITCGGTIPWANFHSGYSSQNDFKLRFALTGTKYWGSYITDVIKLYAEVDSKRVKSHLSANPDIVRQNICSFEGEIGMLGGQKPILIALGVESGSILTKYLGKKYEVKTVMHYSNYISKEDYRKKLLAVLDQ